MTTKKDLKRRARARQAKTGERYATALAQVRARASAQNLDDEGHDATEWALAEGFHCRAAISDPLWKAECALGSPSERFRGVFARLRAMFLALRGSAGLEALCDSILTGSPWVANVPNAIEELVVARSFRAQVRSGVRGVSRNGRQVAFDVPRGDRQVTLLGVFLPRPPHDEERGPFLWLERLAEARVAAWDHEPTLLLAGLGGLAVGGHR